MTRAMLYFFLFVVSSLYERKNDERNHFFRKPTQAGFVMAAEAFRPAGK